MKKFLIALNIIVCALVCVNVAHSAETKTICRSVKQKNGKMVNQCKTIKVHKMYQGTKVPATLSATKKGPIKKPVTKKPIPKKK